MSELLTDLEHEALDTAGRLFGLLTQIVDNGPTREPDIAELTLSIHQIQQAILAQAAARAYPDKYRLLGGVLER